MDSGGLVPDAVIIGMVKDRPEPDCRTATCSTVSAHHSQAEAMKEAGVPIDFVLEIDVPDGDIITGWRAVAPTWLPAAPIMSSSTRPGRGQGRRNRRGPHPARRRQGRNRQEAPGDLPPQTKAAGRVLQQVVGHGDAKAPKVRKLPASAASTHHKCRVSTR